MAFSIKKFFKALLRSKNLNFSMDFSGLRTNSGEELQQITWKGLPYYYRPNTSDLFVAYECILHGKRNAYHSKHLPKTTDVKVIIDIGSNVGASLLFWKSTYPDALIHCFEPVPSNFAVLSKNSSGLSNVFVHNCALGETRDEIKIIHSPGAKNEGGWSIFQRGATGNEKTISVPIYNSGEKLRELGITTIDILKVDTEGAEKLIIAGLGDALLSKTKYICGELHGERDFALLDYLENKGFRIGAKKQPNSVLFNFEAILS